MEILAKEIFNVFLHGSKTGSFFFPVWVTFACSAVFSFCIVTKASGCLIKYQSNYPSCFIDKIIKQVQQSQQVPSNNTNEKENDKKKINQLLLPYQGDKGCHIIKPMNKYVNKLLQNNTNIEVTFKITRLTSRFNVKDKIDFERNHDLIYHLSYGMS